MPCGNGSSDDECGTVMHDVWLFLDDELDPERRAAVQRHLDDCSPCLEVAGLDSKLKRLLARKCGGDHAPENLRQRVVTSLLRLRQGDQVVTVSATSVTTSVTTRRSVESSPDAPQEVPGSAAKAVPNTAPTTGPNVAPTNTVPNNTVPNIDSGR